MPGPVPKRSEVRRRRNKQPEGPAPVRAPSAVSGRLRWPAVDAGWHPVAAGWYRSLRRSGQSEFYEPSDVALACYGAELMSLTLSGEASAANVAATVKVMTMLLTSEGDRRRVRLELERAPGVVDESKVTQMAKYRAAAGRA